MSQGNWSIVSSVGSGFNLPFINRKAVDYRHQMIQKSRKIRAEGPLPESSINSGGGAGLNDTQTKFNYSRRKHQRTQRDY